MNIDHDFSLPTAQDLISLGESLKLEFETLIKEYTQDWLTNNYVNKVDYGQIWHLDRDIKETTEIEAELATLKAFFSSGFIPESWGFSHQTRETEEFYRQKKQPLPESTIIPNTEKLAFDDDYNLTSDLENLEGKSGQEKPSPSQINLIEENNQIQPSATNLQSHSQPENKQINDSSGNYLQESSSNQFYGSNSPQSTHSRKQSLQESIITAKTEKLASDLQNSQWQSEPKKPSASEINLSEDNNQIQPSATNFTSNSQPENGQISSPPSNSVQGLKELAQFLNSQPQLPANLLENQSLSEDNPQNSLSQSNQLKELKNTTESSINAQRNNLLSNFSHEILLSPKNDKIKLNSEEINQSLKFPESFNNQDEIIFPSFWSSDNLSLGKNKEHNSETNIVKFTKKNEYGEQKVLNQSHSEVAQGLLNNNTSQGQITSSSSQNMRAINEFDLPVILEAIAEEINRDYQRFYGKKI